MYNHLQSGTIPNLRVSYVACDWQRQSHFLPGAARPAGSALGNNFPSENFPSENLHNWRSYVRLGKGAALHPSLVGAFFNNFGDLPVEESGSSVAAESEYVTDSELGFYFGVVPP
ncbi:unnamed protein product [Amoebophrya sp. A120]|nr:unnamed protein product [Amoebophrya sp. A120]|eukprot:GSA120T00002632001.1